MKSILKILIAMVIVIGLYFLFTTLQSARRLNTIEEEYSALKSDYSKSVIVPREGVWMVWDIKEKGITINGGSVFDEDKGSSKNLDNICYPKEIKYKKDVSIYDCGSFYAIFILGNPPKPTLYGPFNK